MEALTASKLYKVNFTRTIGVYLCKIFLGLW